jgi:hypothetical protein
MPPKTSTKPVKKVDLDNLDPIGSFSKMSQADKTKQADKFSTSSRASKTLDSEEQIMNEINQQLTEADEYVAIAKKHRSNDARDAKDIDSSDVPDIMTDDVSEKIDEQTSKRIDEEAKEAYMQNDIVDAIVRFMKTDDIICEKERELREYVAPLKKQRTELELFLIDYLEKIEQEYIVVGSKSRLNRVETIVKAPIKPENVAAALMEGFKKHELYSDEQHDEMEKVIQDLLDIVDTKREQKTKKKIARIDVEKEEAKRAQQAQKEAKALERSSKKDNREKVAQDRQAKIEMVRQAKLAKMEKMEEQALLEQGDGLAKQAKQVKQVKQTKPVAKPMAKPKGVKSRA